MSIDFDGVLHVGDIDQSVPFEELCERAHEPIFDSLLEGAIESLRRLEEIGATMFILSCRNITEGRMKGQAVEMLKWLQSKGIFSIKKVWVGMGKPMADIYVDDKMIKYKGDWDQVLRKIEKLKAVA